MAIGGRSEFCGCQKKIQTVLILPSLDGATVSEPTEEKGATEFCARCRKREAEPLEVTFVIRSENEL